MGEIAGGILLVLVLVAVWPYLLLAACVIAILLWLGASAFGQLHPNPVVYVVIGYGAAGLYAYVAHRRKLARPPVSRVSYARHQNDEP